MELAKDQYLLDLSSANAAKSRLYDIELPALEDEFQALESSSIKSLLGLLEKMAALQRESTERVAKSIEEAARALTEVQIERDQEEWVRRHEATVLGAFEAPPDLGFEESAVWHDTVRSFFIFVLSPPMPVFLPHPFSLTRPLFPSPASHYPQLARRLSPVLPADLRLLSLLPSLRNRTPSLPPLQQ
jgi:hypothetical protein